MADHDHDREGKSRLPLILNCVAAALLVILVARNLPGSGSPDTDLNPSEEPDTARLTTTTPAGTAPEEEGTPPDTRDAAIALGDSGAVARALATAPPASRVDGVGVVDELMPPRGFWLKQEGTRMLVIQVRNPANVPEVEVRPGQLVSLDDALIKRDGDVTGIPPQAGAAVVAAAEKERAYLQIRTSRLKVVRQERD